MTEQLAAEVEEALSPVAGRHEAEQLRIANDAALQRLGTMGYGVNPTDIVHLHVAVLLDTVLGDMDDPRRQAYEVAVHTKLAGLLADIGTQIARRKLVEGINGIDPKQLPKRPGQR